MSANTQPLGADPPRRRHAGDTDSAPAPTRAGALFGALGGYLPIAAVHAFMAAVADVTNVVNEVNIC